MNPLVVFAVVLGDQRRRMLPVEYSMRVWLIIARSAPEKRCAAGVQNPSGAAFERDVLAI
jgi:hypothetical protein